MCWRCRYSFFPYEGFWPRANIINKNKTLVIKTYTYLNESFTFVGKFVKKLRKLKAKIKWKNNVKKLAQIWRGIVGASAETTGQMFNANEREKKQTPVHHNIKQLYLSEWEYQSRLERSAREWFFLTNIFHENIIIIVRLFPN